VFPYTTLFRSAFRENFQKYEVQNKRNDCHYSTNQKDRLNHFFITSQIICIIAFFTYKNILIQFYNRFRIKSICSSLSDPMIHMAIHQFVKNNWTDYFEIRFSISNKSSNLSVMYI